MAGVPESESDVSSQDREVEVSEPTSPAASLQEPTTPVPAEIPAEVPRPSEPVESPGGHPTPPTPTASCDIDESRPLLASHAELPVVIQAARPVEVTHYHSLSVHLQGTTSQRPRPGALSIAETDTGGPNDLFSINVTLVWRPHERSEPASPSAMPPISMSVDDLLAMRIVLNASPHATITLHERGGARIGTLCFPNGRDATMAFVTALRAHVDTTKVRDCGAPGELFMLEARPRMRRVAPSLDDLGDGDGVVVGTASGQSRRRDPSGGPMDATQLVDGAPLPFGRRRRSRTNVRDPDAGIFRPSPGMMVLEMFARVTQLARDVGDDFHWAFSEERRRQDAARRERERLARERALNIYADMAWPDADSAGEHRPQPPILTLDTPRGIPVSKEIWTKAFGDDGVLSDPGVIRLAVFAGGLDPEIRREVWPFLLGVFPWDSSGKSREDIRQKNLDNYAKLKSQWLDLKSEATTADAISKAQALEAAAAAAAAAIEKEADAEKRDALIQSGDLRIPEREARVSKLHASYLATDEQIAKDIIRTDRKLDVYKQDNSRMLSMMGDILNVYAVHNRSIGYCQGMSDFVSPLLNVFGEHEEALTFWCFEALMRRYQGNFMVDQSGMNGVLSTAKALVRSCDKELFDFFADSDPDFYCIFRWMLVCFKREMSFESTSRLWEVLWTRQIADDKFHVYIAVALLRAHRRNILKLERGGFDCLLRYVNDMSMRINVDFAVKQAEILYRQLC